MKKAAFVLFGLLLGICSASEYQFIGYQGGKSYSYIERTDLRRYDNGKYKGLVSREIRSQIVEEGSSDQCTLYDGSFYVYEATKRSNAIVFPGLDDSIPSSFGITPEGTLEMYEDNGYPTFRGFPTYTTKQIKPGDSWKANAVRTVDPLNKGIFTKMPILVEYTYLRDEVYNGEEVFLLSAKWATRYGRGYMDPDGDSAMLDASGSNSATIYVSKATGMAVVIRDSVDEIYTYADGNKISFKGTINIFTKYQPAINDDEISTVIQNVTGISDYGDKVNYGKVESDIVNIEKRKNGICLSIPNLQFKSDSSELLDSEKDRLDKLAEILKQAGSSMLLIEGFTADTGNPKGELALSKERAKVIATEMVKRGISSDRFVIKGRGSAQPIADNSTKEGMAKNRRVEITILN
ncbi:MAG: OmpA family protein [Treponema sp.]|uniref:OmpA family protein n=1 Tax=Treponema sp. TaxID=166 RepID=UPI00298E027C|nr:OmpA family protein [Treponema sp.]MCQ2599985.1 OmpA family protein [Treponema sp.]